MYSIDNCKDKFLLGITMSFMVILGIIFSTEISSAGEAPAEVEIAQGKLVGTDTDDTNIVLFAGVPYAAPPVGDLRWKPPAAPLGWEGIRDARAFGAECIQSRSEDGGVFVRGLIKGLGLPGPIAALMLKSIEMAPDPKESEDCLYLNIRTSNLGKDEKHPVMVWIHGGSHQNGAGSRPSYQSNAQVKRGVVLVTINYRLGAFGYLAHPGLSAESEHGVSGNYGLLDQVAALRWVKANIASFGGDPENVTIFGESAGSQAVSEIMATPLASGLYHKAIMESGVASRFIFKLKSPNAMMPASESAGAAFFEQSGLAPNDADAATLRAISADQIIAGVTAHPIYRGVFLPTADGHVLPTLIGSRVLDHKMFEVPILIGYNSDEGSLFYTFMKSPSLWLRDLPEDPEARREAVRQHFGDDGETLIELYGLDDDATQAEGESDMLGDDYFGVHTRMMAREHASRGLSVYLYNFSRVPPSSKQTVGAYHSAEIPFVFDSHMARRMLGKEDKALTVAMGDYWTNFAKTGNPNGDGLVEWSAYDVDQDNWLQLDHQIQEIHRFRKEKLDALEPTMRKLIEGS
jgi:para-nitrobenzyl esterase